VIAGQWFVLPAGRIAETGPGIRLTGLVTDLPEQGQGLLEVAGGPQTAALPQVNIAEVEQRIGGNGQRNEALAAALAQIRL
jgi:hypothetical protein